MGAVIAMRGLQANRRQLFDIGLSGPWAGLVIALPLAILGVREARVDIVHPGLRFGDPLVFQWLIGLLRRDVREGWELVMNPYLMAAWVGLFVTGLNMIPVGQLDGGHVAYAIFGRKAHWLARAMVGLAVGFIVYTGQYGLMLMLGLVVFIGIHHPPTADDRAPLGAFRRVVGLVSLAIPILCLPVRPIDIIPPSTDDILAALIRFGCAG
jgi:membrane-associated protease RseP (regulator of RpoE activity)